MISDQQIKWIKEKSQTAEGQEWIKFIAEYANLLYNVKGVPLDQVLSRQLAAEHLEKLVALSQDKEPKPRLNEYL